jgi:hypothetical protein
VNDLHDQRRHAPATPVPATGNDGKTTQNKPPLSTKPAARVTAPVEKRSANAEKSHGSATPVPATGNDGKITQNKPPLSTKPAARATAPVEKRSANAEKSNGSATPVPATGNDEKITQNKPPLSRKTPEPVGGKNLPTGPVAGINDQLGGVNKFLLNSGRRVVNMPGDNNNCGFHTILSQVKGKYSAEDIGALRKLVGITGSEMFETDLGHGQKVADFYDRPIIAITRCGDAVLQCEMLVPNWDRRLFFDKNSVIGEGNTATINLGMNFRSWVQYYVRDDKDPAAIVDSMIEGMRPHMPQDFNSDDYTVLQALLALHKNKRTISMIHSGGHFMAGHCT